MAEIRELPDRRSKCPYCGVRGVKQYQPIISDGVPCDRPYCGVCGKNYPEDAPTREFPAPMQPRLGR